MHIVLFLGVEFLEKSVPREDKSVNSDCPALARVIRFRARRLGAFDPSFFLLSHRAREPGWKRVVLGSGEPRGVTSSFDLG